MSKLPHIGTTIFTVMSQLANETGAINLSQGFPNFPIDDRFKEIAKETTAMDSYQYRPMAGSVALLKTIAKKVEENYNRTLNPTEEILITAGATEGIFCAIMALVDKGDEVIVLDPSYDSYEPTIRLSGGTPVRVPLSNEFTPDWSRIEEAFSSQTKMILINNPHNPSGRVWTKEDMSLLEQILAKYPDVILLSDEVYEYITYELPHISINTIESLKNRSVIVSSFGKTLHITGWKTGYLVAPKDLMTEIKKVHQFNVFCVNSFSQDVINTYLQELELLSLGDFYKVKRDLFQAQLKQSNFTLLPCEGTYFQTVSYEQISDEGDVDFCKRLTIEHGIAAIPISVFNEGGRDNKTIRFCFAKDEETLTKAGEILCKI